MNNVRFKGQNIIQNTNSTLTPTIKLLT